MNAPREHSPVAPRAAAGMLVVVAFVAWFALTPRYVPDLVFPSPASVVAAIKSIGIHLLMHAATTLGRVLLGWLIGVVAGVAFGFWISWSSFVYQASKPFIEIVRPLPATALVPFFIIWFGLGLFGQALLIAIAVSMVMLIETHNAIQNLSVVYFRAASSLGATTGRIYRTVVVPAILPSLLGALRISAALAFGVGVVAEFMGAQSGLGYMIMVARRTLNTNTILLGTLLIGGESLMLDAAIRVTVKRFTKWQEDPRDALMTIERRKAL